MNIHVQHSRLTNTMQQKITHQTIIIGGKGKSTNKTLKVLYIKSSTNNGT